MNSYFSCGWPRVALGRKWGWLAPGYQKLEPQKLEPQKLGPEKLEPQKTKQPATGRPRAQRRS
jgi:hypothetical protein